VRKTKCPHTNQVQVPNATWQPVPQYVVPVPHQPYCEQHVPNVEPLQVTPVPQLPSVDTRTVAVPLAAALLDDTVPQVPKPVWQPVPQ
jgi:hypothetical protein